MTKPNARPPLAPFRETAAGLIFVSGQLPRGADGGIVPGGIEAQARRALENLSGVLDSAGASLSDVVKTTVWITDPAAMAQFNAIYETFFSAPYPARSTVVSGLVAPDALLEIEAVAVRA
ncbi:RidA family protein [uncultured Sphingomonas sp.]|uniref:RidA family protein n=1 Tax=uncultured Sphingomonas sp. TaxID=158754 RepID=UPI00260A8D69|nr:RidA family protein [uncultured Sphingomonas sp.]